MRLRESKDALAQAARLDPRVIVALSGGKDSITTLDICSKIFPPENIRAFYMYLVPNLRCIEGPIDALAKRYGISVMKVPHWGLQEHLKKGIYAPASRNHRTRQTSFKDVAAFVRKATGYRWIAIGQRMSDGFSRWFYLSRIGAMDKSSGYLYPIWSWRKRDVLEYLKVNGLPLPAEYGQDKRRLHGFDLRADTLSWMKANHPEDYARVLEVFPLIEAINVKREFTTDRSRAVARAI